MSKTFAEKYWKEFELLALQYVREQYKDISAQCVHTAFIKDGGYDGHISIDLTKNDSIFYHQILSLIEAKLRTSSNVNISDFAASIIAAYNSAANTLYIVSNKNFTQDTYTITQTFSKKVNLSIILVEGKQLLNWIQNRKHTFSDTVFYEQLVESIQSINSKIKNTNTINNSENNFEIFLISPDVPEQKVDVLKLFGLVANQARDEIISLLCNTNAAERYFVLHGPIGCGKSTIIKNLEKDLQSKDYLFSIIDGESYESTSIRTLYICILKAIWAIDPTKLCNISNFPEFISLICSSCGVYANDGIKETISEIFNQSHKQVLAKSDLYIAYLLRYLELILQGHKGNNRTIIAFKNLHCMDIEVLDFLLPLIKCLVKSKIGIIVELDSPTTLNITKKYWKKYYDAFLYNSNNNLVYEIGDFSKDEAYEYLKEHLPGLGMKYYEFMLSHIGLRPIFLKHAIDWLLLDHIIEGTDDNTYYTVSKPEEFFNGITPNQNIKIVENIIGYYQWVHDCCENIKKIFEATIIMEGVLEKEFLSEICIPHSFEEIVQILLDSGLYIQTNNSIKIAHHLIMIALKNKSLQSYKQNMAAELLKYINLKKDNEIYKYKKVDLLEILQEWDLLYELSYEYGNYFYNEGEYNSCIKYFAKCQAYYDNIKNQNHTEFLDILYKQLFAYHKIGSGTQQKTLHNLYRFHMQIEKRRTKKRISSTYELIDKMYCARLAEAKEQYQLTQEMLKYAKNTKNEITNELYEEVCFVYVLIEKKHKTLDSAIQFLKEERDTNPNSIKLDIEYQSHKAAKYLNSNPQKALGYYQNIIHYSGISKHYSKSIGHAYVDILTCYLLLENWNAFNEIYPKVLEYVQSNAQFAEEGRIYNLDGLYYWINDDLELADISFRDAQFYLDLVHNQTLSTLVKINFVGLLIAYNKKKEAKLECEIAYRLMKKNYALIFKQIELTKNYRRHREYAGLLALAKYSKSLDLLNLNEDMKKEIPISIFQKHLEIFEKDIYPDDVFADTYILHSNIICLTR